MNFKLYNKYNENIASFQCLELFAKIAIAVSGGCDSMALLDLTAKWAHNHNKEIVVMHIDHNLRNSSGVDALHVKNYCDDNNITNYILKWDHKNIKGNIQHKARSARYQMLLDLCNKIDIKLLLTGHHLEDNAENFIQRLIRGSGIIGLGSCSEHFFNNVRILRPLFNITKNECINHLKSQNIKWIEDESNKDTKYLRNDIRINLSGILEKQHISYDQLLTRIANTQNHFDNVIFLLKEKLTQILAENCFIEDMGYVTIDYLSLKKENIYIMHLILSYLITIISGKNELPRSCKIEHLINNIKDDSVKYFTLHDTKITFKNNIILITYQKNNSKINTSNKLVDNLLWDNRFLFKISKKLQHDNLSIDFCTEKEYIEIIEVINLDLKKHFDKKALKDIILSLPTVRMNDKIVAIKQINYYDKNTRYLEEDLKVMFYPKFQSKLIHF